jgi:hypothetical protein
MLGRLLRTFGLLGLGLAATLIVILVASAFAERQVPASLPPMFVSTDQWDRYVAGSGTWVIENDRSATPLQTSDLICQRENMMCVMSNASISSGRLSLDTFRYVVTRWTQDTLIFERDALCAAYTYTIDRATKRAFGVRLKKQSTDTLCESVQSDRLTLALTDGFSVWWRLNDEARQGVMPYAWSVIGIVWFWIGSRAWRTLRTKPEPRPALT